MKTQTNAAAAMTTGDKDQARTLKISQVLQKNSMKTEKYLLIHPRLMRIQVKIKQNLIDSCNMKEVTLLSENICKFINKYLNKYYK